MNNYITRPFEKFLFDINTFKKLYDLFIILDKFVIIIVGLGITILILLLILNGVYQISLKSVYIAKLNIGDSVSNIIFFPIKFLYFRVFYPTDSRLIKSLEQPRFRQSNGKKWFYSSKHKISKVRFSNVKTSVFHSPGTTFSLFISYVSIFIGFVLFILDKISSKEFKLTESNDFFNFFTIIMILLFIPLPVYLRSYIRNLPIDQYCALVVNSLNESQLITFISYKVWVNCNGFDRKTEWLFEPKEIYRGLEKINTKIIIDNDEYKDLYSNVKRKDFEYFKQIIEFKVIEFIRSPSKMKKLITFMEDSEIELQRITSLISELSLRANIPSEEICDHIFQFNPKTYLIWQRKFVSNFSEISSLSQNGTFGFHSKTLYKNIGLLLAECGRFRDRNASFMYYQCQNMAFDDLHNSILAFSSQLSSSESVKVYISAIGEIALDYNRSFTNKLGFNWKNLYRIKHLLFKIKNTEPFINRIAYIYYKRRAHIGLDLHHSAKRILKEVLKSEFFVKENDEVKFKYLELWHFLEDKYFEDNLKEYCRDALPNTHNFFNYIDALSEFPSYSFYYIEQCRKEICEKFFEKKIFDTENSIENWITSLVDGGYLFIVTFGYSHIVGEVIKKLLPKLLIVEEKNTSFFDSFGKIQFSKVKVILFQLDNKSDIDSSIIKFHLTEEGEASFKNILVSHPNFIIPLIDKKSKVLVLMGAEAFDNSKRVIRTNCYKEIIGSFIDKVQKNMLSAKFGLNKRVSSPNLKIVVLAEEYKSNSDFREINTYFDDQFDKIEMYEPELISIILTNKQSIT